MKVRYSGLFANWVSKDCVMFIAVGVVRIRNVKETVMTMAVPLVAALARARLADSVELLWHLAAHEFEHNCKICHEH